MNNTFSVNIYTPKQQFLSTEASSLVLNGLEGEICIWKDHMPLLLALNIGALKIKTDGEWRTAVVSEGYLEFNRNSAEIFVDSCEWAESLESAKTQIARLKKKDAQSILEHKHNEITLARMVSSIGKPGKRSGTL